MVTFPPVTVEFRAKLCVPASFWVVVAVVFAVLGVVGFHPSLLPVPVPSKLGLGVRLVRNWVLVLVVVL